MRVHRVRMMCHARAQMFVRVFVPYMFVLISCECACSVPLFPWSSVLAPARQPWSRQPAAAHLAHLQPRAHIQGRRRLCKHENGTPASTNAPSSMSPLMPEKHSRYPIRIALQS